MSVFKSSNHTPNLQEIDITKENTFSCQVNTSGESIKAYKIYTLSSTGEEKTFIKDNLETPLKNKGYFKKKVDSTNLQKGLINGKDYQWGIRLYNAELNSNKQPNTVVCNGYLVGSTKYVIWTDNNENIVEDRYLEIETTGPDQIFDIIDNDDKTLVKPATGVKHIERHKIEWVTRDLGKSKNITKIELDEDFKYNYIDGTPFKIFKCSDQHTVNSCFVEPNDEIKSSNYITIYETKALAAQASAAGDTPDKVTITPRETGRKIIGYSIDTGEIRVQESFSKSPVNGNAYLLYEYDSSTKTYTEKKFTDVSNVIGGEAVITNLKIKTNKIVGDKYQLFIQPNINIKTDKTNPNELVFSNTGTRLDIKDNTIEKLDNTQWLLTNLKKVTNSGDGTVPIIPKSPYTIYTDFMDSAPYCIFYARQEPKPTIMYKNTNFLDSDFEPIEDESGQIKVQQYRDITFKMIVQFIQMLKTIIILV